jgi:hypothetical protein
MKTKYNIDAVKKDTGNIVQNFNDFLNQKDSGELHCGAKVYQCLQMSDKFKPKPTFVEERVEFPHLFGEWVNGDKTFYLFLSPNENREDEFFIVNS